MIEKIIELSARNRFLVLLLTAFAAVAGWWSFRNTPVDAIPDLSDPQVIVFTEWMGRSPTLVEDQVTYPIVSGLLAAPKVTDVRGFSMFGMSFIYVVFEEGTDLYWARSRVLEYLSAIQRTLPADAAPTLGPDATGIGWVFSYALVDRSGKHDLADLRTFQDFSLRYAVASVPGVAEVASVGGYQKQYQVTVDPDRLRGYDVTLPEVVSAIRRSNSDVGGRIVEMSQREYYVRGRGYVTDLADVENVVVRATEGGTPILVKDVGEVRFGPDIRRGLAELDGNGETVGAIVVMRYGENAREVIERVKRKLEEAKSSFPDGVEAVVTYDRSSLIDRAAETLNHALLEEMLVVALVIGLFLLHARSTLVAAIAIPLGVLISFVPMRLTGMTSNIMSLGGIAIAIGAMVDAAIVMVENAHKRLEHAPPGANRREVLIEAAKEAGPAIFFSLLIITVAFLPIFTLPGQGGRLFKPLAYTKTFVMAAGALLSITLIPALLELFVRGKIHPEARHPVSKFVIRGYEPFVYVALRNPKTTVLIGLAALVSAVPLFLRLGSEFMPPLNEGDMLYMPITYPNISLEEAKSQLQLQDRILRETPEVKSVFGKVGRAESPTDPAPITMVETVVQLKPTEEWRTIHVDRWWSFLPSFLEPPFRLVWPDERRIGWQELIQDLDMKMQFPGWTNAWTMPIKTRVDMLTTGIRTPIGIKVFGKDLDEIERIGIDLESVIAPIPGTRSVLYERNLGGLYIDIVPRREALARHGLTVGDVQEIIEAALGGSVVTTTVEGRNRFSVNVRYPRDLRDDLDRIREILVPIGGSPGGGGTNGMNGMKGADARPASPPSTRLADGARRWPPRGILLAQMEMGGGRQGGVSTSRPGLPEIGGMATDAMPAMPTMRPMNDGMAESGMRPMPGGAGASAAGGSRSGPGATSSRVAHVPLGQLADVRIVGGPPMVRDEDGLLVGYVYVDIDLAQRDIGGYVHEAKAAVEEARKAGRLGLPSGYYLKWTGQYELLEEMVRRMKVVVPLTFGIVVLLLFLHFRNVLEVLIVLLSIPFALVGSVWLLYLLDYRLSTAVWVGIIALVGLAAQTGIVMIVYIDHAYERRKRAGKIRDLYDIIRAHTEGTVQRVRPKLMTVSTMLIGLVPLLWASGSGADVMKRIAAPMVGGLLTSAFLTLEIIPVIYTYWRREQLLWERLEERRDEGLARLKVFAYGLAAVGTAFAGIGVLAIVLSLSRTWAATLSIGLILLGAAGIAGYVRERAPAVRALAAAKVRW